MAEALREVRSEMRSLVDDAKRLEGGVQTCAEDVLDRVAASWMRCGRDGARGDWRPSGTRSRPFVPRARLEERSAGGETSFGESFASAAELAALAERVSLAETVAERAGARRPRCRRLRNQKKARSSRLGASPRHAHATSTRSPRSCRRGCATTAPTICARASRARASCSDAEDEPQPPLHEIASRNRRRGVRFLGTLCGGRTPSTWGARSGRAASTSSVQESEALKRVIFGCGVATGYDGNARSPQPPRARLSGLPQPFASALASGRWPHRSGRARASDRPFRSPTHHVRRARRNTDDSFGSGSDRTRGSTTARSDRNERRTRATSSSWQHRRRFG